MKLITLTLNNYQSLKEFTMSPNGKSVTISGPNGSGKSTIASSISWLLTGKSADGGKNYSPKPLDADGNEIHHLVTSAECVLDDGNGGTLTLKKELHENWKRKKSGAEEFAGNTVDSYINGEPTTDTMYKKTLAGYFTPDESMMLSIPSYFAEELGWEERRRILLSISGGITDAEVIASDDALKSVPAIFKKTMATDATEALQRLQRNEKDLKNDKADMLPRIDEASRSIPDTTGFDRDAIEKALQDEERTRQSLAEKKVSLSKSDKVNAIRKRISDLENVRISKKADYLLKGADLNRDTEDRITELMKKSTLLRSDIRRMESSLEDMNGNVEDLRAKKDRKLEEYKKLDTALSSIGKADTVDTICPVCHQRLPESMIAEKKAELSLHLETEKNRIKAEMNKVIANGRELKAEIEELETRIAETEESLSRSRADLEETDKAKKKAESEIRTLPSFDDLEDVKAIDDEINRLRSSLTDESASESEAVSAIDDEIGQSDIRSRVLQGKLYLLDAKVVQENRVKELQQNLDEMEKKLTETACDIRTLQLFIRKRAEMLDNRIASLFDGVRFRLTEVLINGTIRECCEPIVKAHNGWIPYSQASNAERINGGIEIIRVLSTALKKSMPIVIDNAESVISLREPDGLQLIALRVEDTATGGLEEKSAD